MGQRAALSTLDVHGVRSLYPDPNWSFVDANSPSPWNGSGFFPWRQISDALLLAPAGSLVFVMPASYPAQGLWTQPMTFEAPLGGVILQ